MLVLTKHRGDECKAGVNTSCSVCTRGAFPLTGDCCNFGIVRVQIKAVFLFSSPKPTPKPAPSMPSLNPVTMLVNHGFRGDDEVPYDGQINFAAQISTDSSNSKIL